MHFFRYLSKLKIYLSKLQNAFVQIAIFLSKLLNIFVKNSKCIYPNNQMYLSKLQYMFVQTVAPHCKLAISRWSFLLLNLLGFFLSFKCFFFIPLSLKIFCWMDSFSAFKFGQKLFCVKFTVRIQRNFTNKNYLQISLKMRFFVN